MPAANIDVSAASKISVNVNAANTATSVFHAAADLPGKRVGGTTLRSSFQSRPSVPFFSLRRKALKTCPSWLAL
jgi:hypothetical protein